MGDPIYPFHCPPAEASAPFGAEGAELTLSLGSAAWAAILYFYGSTMGNSKSVRGVREG